MLHHNTQTSEPMEPELSEDARFERDRLLEITEGGFGFLQGVIHADAVKKGWWAEPREDPTAMMLAVTELAEAVEAMRSSQYNDDGSVTYPPSAKIPGFNHVEEELADVVIRLLDFAGYRGLNIGPAIYAKLMHNRGRQHRHGGRAF